MVSVTQQGKKSFVLKTVGAVATHFISHFGLAEVHHQKHISNTSAMHSVLCLEVGGHAGIIARGCRQMASSAAHQHPPFLQVTSALHQHCIVPPAYLYAVLKVWGTFRLCYCLTICRHLPPSCRMWIHWGGNGELNHKHPPATGSSVQHLWQKLIYVILRSSSVLIYRTWLSSEIPRHMLPKCCSINKVTNKALIFISLLKQFLSERIS